jgi:hypothetical protein
MKRLPWLSAEWCFRQGQKQFANRKMRDRLKMLHQEKKRLRKLRQAGLDPVLDVVD